MKKKNNFIIFLSISVLILIFLGVYIIRTRDFSPISSEAASSDIDVLYDLTYGNLPKQKLDLCKPKDVVGRLPGVMLVHGGGSDKSSYTSICKNLAKAGFVAIAVNYREDPPPTYKVILADNNKAISWLAGQDYVDSEKLGVWGGSMGGYVSSMAGTHDEGVNVKCVSNNYGPTDFTDPSEWEGSVLMEEAISVFFGGVTIEENPNLYKLLSPIKSVSGQSAQNWLFTRSTNDHLIPRTQMTKMIAELGKYGIEAEFYEYNGTGGGHANKLGPLQGLKLLRTRMDFMTGCLNNL